MQKAKVVLGQTQFGRISVRRERKSRHECHAPSFARARARRRFFAPWRLCVLAFNRKGAKTQRREEHGLAASPRDRRVAALGSADTSIAEPAGCRQRRLPVAVPDWTPLARRAFTERSAGLLSP